MGFRGTWSCMLFYRLDELYRGDEVLLKDRSGKAYRYRVSEVFITEPTDSFSGDRQTSMMPPGRLQRIDRRVVYKTAWKGVVPNFAHRLTP